MTTKIGTINPPAGGGGGLSVATPIGWTAGATYVIGNIVNRTGWLFVAVLGSTGIDPELDDGSHWTNLYADIPPLAWNSSATYGLYNLAVHAGGIWAATSATVMSEPAGDNSDWYRIYRIVADNASVVFTGHGSLPDPPPENSVDGDLYFNLDDSTFTPITIATGGGDVG